MKNVIFALDIGTRSVTGILLQREENNYEVKKHVVIEHQDRSMLDGQIHNVMQVANVIQEVKTQLEIDGDVLEDVYVAAAGRSLKTVREQAEIDLQDEPFSTMEMVKHLELSAVHNAQLKLVEEHTPETLQKFYCVGYSVIHYRLDDDIIGSLIDQHGKKASVEVIATFLPKIVVESLVASLQRAGLKMKALTLEPIAAIQVLIPESMRRLNVALVDIGAGTSDIALTNEGTVTAYGMVPIAGDEITEALSDEYLLDYPKAEAIKRTISKEHGAIIQDILGMESEISYEEFTKTITPAVEQLGETISEEILKLNGQSPRAVMLIGGGSLTPNIQSVIAEKLKLPENRVAVRGVDAIQNLIANDTLPTGPDFITPIGIAIAAEEKPVHYISIQVNQQLIRMFEMRRLTLGDCLIQAGVDIRKYYGKPGESLFIQVNNSEIILPGMLGTAPELTLNQKEATVDDFVHDGDTITITPGNEGESARVTIKELVGDISPIHVTYNNELTTLLPLYYVNEKEVSSDTLLADNDNVKVEQIISVNDFLAKYVTEKDISEKPFNVFVNREQVNIPTAESKIMINGKSSSMNQKLQDGDKLTCTHIKHPTLQDVMEVLDKHLWKECLLFFNDKPVTLRDKKYEIFKDNSPIDLSDSLQLNEEITMKEIHSNAFIFQDVFRYVNIDLSQATGRFTLIKNDERATFDTEVFPGDKLQIAWRDS